MLEIDQQAEQEIRELVYDYFASECDIERNRRTDVCSCDRPVRIVGIMIIM